MARISSGQVGVGLIAPKIHTGDQTEICVPISTLNFADVGAFQTGLHFNPTVLSFNGSINEMAIGDIDVGTREVTKGILHILWFTPFNIPGTTIENEDVLFELCFNIIGAPGTYSEIIFEDFPYYNIEFSDSEGSTMRHFVSPGRVNIGFPNAVPTLSEWLLIILSLLLLVLGVAMLKQGHFILIKQTSH